MKSLIMRSINSSLALPTTRQSSGDSDVAGEFLAQFGFFIFRVQAQINLVSQLLHELRLFDSVNEEVFVEVQLDYLPCGRRLFASPPFQVWPRRVAVYCLRALPVCLLAIFCMMHSFFKPCLYCFVVVWKVFRFRHNLDAVFYSFQTRS